MKHRIEQQWLVPLGSLLAAGLAAVGYGCTASTMDPLAFWKLAGLAAVPFVLPLLGQLTHKPYPIWLNALVAVHIALAGYGGSVLGWYDVIPGWDLLMHGLFGVVAAALMDTLLQRWNGQALQPVGYHFLLVFSVMGGAAVWELFEFLSDWWLGTDSQRVQEALRLGISPVEDTMTDILVTAVGVAVFYGIWLIKKAAHRKNR